MFDARTEQALAVAISAHQGQVRRGHPECPYSVHPLHMALLLERLGSSPLVVQAALLHDVVEDCEGWTQARLAQQFGPVVAAVVAELTEDKSKTWDQRKRTAVEHVPELSAAALEVKAADKLHNLWSLAEQLRSVREPAVVWQLFRGGRARTLALAHDLIEALALRLNTPLIGALREALAEVERLG